ncbi:hypothetical protein [Microbacterium sp.]|uniref:hypothetical protein n=1 Tax=Microbacterium sp. TaxID=51671 RepID=UPI003C784E23
MTDNEQATYPQDPGSVDDGRSLHDLSEKRRLKAAQVEIVLEDGIEADETIYPISVYTRKHRELASDRLVFAGRDSVALSEIMSEAQRLLWNVAALDVRASSYRFARGGRVLMAQVAAEERQEAM